LASIVEKDYLDNALYYYQLDLYEWDLPSDNDLFDLWSDIDYSMADDHKSVAFEVYFVDA
jgi:hypothetical protein